MKLRSISFAALVALVLVACGGGGSRVITPTGPGPTPNPTPNPNPNPQPQPTPPTLDVTKIMAFGDSLTEGESLGRLLGPTNHDPSGPGVVTSYPYKLLTTLTTTYTGQASALRVYNFGHGGEFVVGSQAKERLNSGLNGFQPDVLLLLHGVNNVNAPNDAIITIVEAIEELVELAYVRGVKHVFIGNLPPQIPTTKATGGARIAEFNSWLPSVAAEEGATLVDIHSNINTATMLMEDGLHLNETGNIKLAELFYAAIKAKYHKEPAQ